MEDFYVVLPSNVHNLTDQKNTAGHYTTYLPKPIVLDNERWKVAVVEVTLRASWYNVVEENAAIILQKAETTKKVTIAVGYYSCLEDLIEEINSCIRKNYRDFGGILEKTDNKTTLILTSNEGVRFTPTLAAMLGFDKHLFFKRPGTLVNISEAFEDIDHRAVGKDKSKKDEHKATFLAEHVGDVNIGLQNIYLYSNIVEDTVVGSSYTPLLRTVPAVAKEHGGTLHYEFVVPQYKHLSTGIITVIEIKLCDDLGSIVRFDDGNVIVKLHFKKIVEVR